MTPADVLRALDGFTWTDEDGERMTCRVTPPPPPAELAALEARLGGALPADARDLLAVGRGLDGGPLEAIDFAGALDDGLETELFPSALPIAHDGFGNFWVVERQPGAATWGPVYYVAHDPAVAVYQGPDLADFLAGLRGLMEPPYRGPLDEVHEAASARIWHEHPGAVPQPEALQSADPAVRAFAASLGPEWWVVDLRTARRGDGLAWGRFGPRTRLRRAGSLPLFGYGPPPREPSWWRRLWGGRRAAAT